MASGSEDYGDFDGAGNGHVHFTLSGGQTGKELLQAVEVGMESQGASIAINASDISSNSGLIAGNTTSIHNILDGSQILEIVNSFFDKMEYDERRKWIWENVPEPNAVLLDIGITGEQPPFVYEKGQE